MTSAGPTDYRDMAQDEHSIASKAKRSLLVDSTGVAFSASNKLPVEASLVVEDIEIGAVELKDGSSDNRATVSSGGALKVDGSASTQPVSGSVGLLDSSGSAINSLYPLPVSSDSVYVSDINPAYSSAVGWTGSYLDLFKDLHTGIYNDTITNPKVVTLWFYRTVYLDAIGLGCALVGKTFSNIKLEFLGSDGTVRYTYNDSANNVKYGTRLYSFTPTACVGIVISVCTANTDVGLTNVTIRKAQTTLATIQGVDEDTGVVTPISTAGGDFNVLARLRNATGNTKINPATSDAQTTGNNALTAINNKLVNGTDIGDVTVNNSTGTGAVNIQDGGNSITVDGAVTASISSSVGMKYVDTSDVVHGFINNAGAPQICAQSYLQALSEGDIPNHATWSKIGYNGAIVANTEADVWSGTGTITYPLGNVAIAVVSSVATTDTGTSIFSGTSSGGTTTSLVDATKNFNGGTAVEVGDIIVLDKSGVTPEWGYVTAVTSNTELEVSGGFSSSGTGYGSSGRAYVVLDKSTALQTGAKAVQIEYLTPAYAQRSEIVILNGNTEVNTVNTNIFRVNSFRVIAVGSGAKPAGNLSLKALTPATTLYSYISAGYTRARNISYTVPIGKTLYITSASFGYAYSHNSTHYARIYTRANIEPSSNMNTGDLFYPFTEVVCSNNTVVREFECPTKIPAKTDIKVSTIADYAGIVEVTLRGWLE